MKQFFFYSFLVSCFFLFSSHDLFIKFDQYYLASNSEARLALYNGTFDKSENSITRDRMQNVVVTGAGYTEKPGADQWYDQDEKTFLNFKTGPSGTYVVGVSTKARDIELSADDFNNYLEHDGVLDVLADRKAKGEDKNDAVESYSKHVKAIVQVGDGATNDYSTVLGYPIEFVPMDNPYTTGVDGTIRFQLLSNGEPLADQLVYAGVDNHSKGGHSHADGDTHEHHETKMMTDKKGMLALKVTEKGDWFLRTIHMVESDSKELDYVSNWATITFAVR